MYLDKNEKGDRVQVWMRRDGMDKTPDQLTFLVLLVLPIIIIYLNVSGLVFLSWIVLIYNILRFLILNLYAASFNSFEVRDGDLRFGNNMKNGIPLNQINQVVLDVVDEKVWKIQKPDLDETRGGSRSNSEGFDILIGLLGLLVESVLYLCRLILQVVRKRAIYYRLSVQGQGGEYFGFAYTRAYHNIDKEVYATDLESLLKVKVAYNEELITQNYFSYLGGILNS